MLTNDYELNRKTSLFYIYLLHLYLSIQCHNEGTARSKAAIKNETIMYLLILTLFFCILKPIVLKYGKRQNCCKVFQNGPSSLVTACNWYDSENYKDRQH